MVTTVGGAKAYLNFEGRVAGRGGVFRHPAKLFGWLNRPDEAANQPGRMVSKVRELKGLPGASRPTTCSVESVTGIVADGGKSLAAIGECLVFVGG